jgi:hypothetical protein
MAERTQLYDPYSKVGATASPTPYMHIPRPDVTFTDAIGRALGELGKGVSTLGGAQVQVGAALAHFGGSLEGAGDEIFKRASAIKAVENDTAATEAHVKFGIEGHKMTEAFEATQGNASTGSLDAHMKTLEDQRQKIRTSLNNDQARNMFDQSSLKTLGSLVAQAGKHAAGAGKKALVDAATAQWKLTLDEVGKDPDNPGNLEKLREGRENYVRKIAPITGEVGDVLKLKLMDIESTFHASMISGIAKKDTARAWSQLDEKRKYMMAPDIEKVENTITGRELIAVPRIIGQKQTEDMNRKKTNQEMDDEKGLRERVDEGLKELEKSPTLTKDPEVYATAKRAVVDAVTHDYNKVIGQRADDRTRALRDIDTALSGDLHPSKKPPETMDELNAYEKVPPAIAMLRTKADRDYVARGLKQNQAKLAEVDPMVSYGRWEKLRGMAAGGRSQEFLDATEKLFDLGLNPADRALVKQLREKVLGDPRGDPRVRDAWRVLQETRGHEMSALGIDGARNQQNKDDIDAAHGALDDALTTFREVKGRAPSRDEIKNEIGPQVLKYRAGTWFPWRSSEYPSWSTRTDVPDQFKQDYDKRLIASGLKPPESRDDMEYRRAYIHKLFLESMKHPEPEAIPKPGVK